MGRGKENHVEALNVLRVVATLSVFMLHTTLYEPGINDLFSVGGADFLFRTPAWSAVWIFLVTGGYFAGKGFAESRYLVNLNGSWKYYKKRIVKVIFPTLCFIFLCAALSFPGFFVENPRVLVEILTFTYQGNVGVSGISATWYVFSLFWFYLITPFVAILLNRLKNKKSVLWTLLILLAFVNLAWRCHALNVGLEWNKYVYVPPVFNVDLYVGGMIFAYINSMTDEKKPFGVSRKVLKIVSVCLAVVAFVANAYLYNQAHFGVHLGYSFSGFYFQTIWLVVCIFFLAAFDYKRSPNAKLSWRALLSNPLRIIDAFSIVSFEFYLFHSLVLDRCAAYVLGGRVLTWGLHVKLLLIAGLVTLVLSIGYHRIFNVDSRKRESERN